MFGFQSQKSHVGTLLSEEREILKCCLDSALQSGDDSAAAMQKILARKYPDLIREELDVYSRICKSAVKFGHDLVNSVPAQDRPALMPMWQAATLAEFPWLSDDSLELLLTRDVYHSENDTLPELTANSIPGYGLTL
ncbi:hypothetical protein [Undibacterium sp.]|jgi:hypothetical protein|uniref:hypothetical protein n=1 Tax=Undibacterium sp. TaxID=1914977 RepID=UPI002CF43407|nr:hypothetical protein [Undibacterium sp.]HTD06396.1 hypothetical protein [Undibacterium sp.]